MFNSGILSHAILVDDACCFGSDLKYFNLDKLKEFHRSGKANVDISLENDSMRIVPLHNNLTKIALR